MRRPSRRSVMATLNSSVKFFTELFAVWAEADEVLTGTLRDKADAKPAGIDSFVVVVGAIDIATAAGQRERNSMRNAVRVAEHLIRQVQSVSARSLSHGPIPFRSQRLWRLV